MTWENIKQPLLAGIVALVSALGGTAGGAYIASKPAEVATPAAQISKAITQLQLVEGMTGLCFQVSKAKP